VCPRPVDDQTVSQFPIGSGQPAAGFFLIKDPLFDHGLFVPLVIANNHLHFVNHSAIINSALID
jgi:hypothetical protein